MQLWISKKMTNGFFIVLCFEHTWYNLATMTVRSSWASAGFNVTGETMRMCRSECLVCVKLAFSSYLQYQLSSSYISVGCFGSDIQTHGTSKIHSKSQQHASFQNSWVLRDHTLARDISVESWNNFHLELHNVIRWSCFLLLLFEKKRIPLHLISRLCRWIKSMQARGQYVCVVLL